MTPPCTVPAARVRRLPVREAQPVPVQHVAPPTVPAPHVVPRQLDPVRLRLMALQLENDELRAQLHQLRAG